MAAKATAHAVDRLAPAQAPPEAVGPLIRGITVIRALTEVGGRQDLQDLSRRTGLARATLDRITTTLGVLGYLRLEGREAVLAPRLMELGNAYLSAARVPEVLGPRADALAAELDEVVTVTVPDRHGAHIVHIAKPDHRMVLVCSIGDCLPLEASAPGALFAATWTPQEWELHRAHHLRPRRTDHACGCTAELWERAEASKADGWSLDDQWLEAGLVALGIPVHASDGSLLCVINVTSHIGRHPNAESLARAALPAARRAAAQVKRDLGVPRPAVATGNPTPTSRRTAASKSVLGSDFVESLARGLGVLTTFGPDRPALRSAEIARLADLPRATARRALITLDHLGYLTHQAGLYRPAAALLSLGYAPLSGLTLAQVGLPHLAALSKQWSESVSMSVLSGTDIRYLARAAATRLMTVDVAVGTRFPAYATAMGRVLLADLPRPERAALLAASDPVALTPRTVTEPDALHALLEETGAEGYALVEEELQAGLRSIAVPVRDHHGRACAAINIAMHPSRRTVADCVDRLLPPLRSAAEAIELDLAAVARFGPPPVGDTTSPWR